MFQEEDILRLKDAIEKAQTIGILVRENPDMDSMAAGLSLYLVLSQILKKTVVSCATLPTVGISSLVGIDKVQKELAIGNDLTISLPYSQGTIEKISYNIEGDRIQLVVKAGEKGINFDSSDIEYMKTGGSGDLIFTIGMRDASEAKKVTTLEEKTMVVNIDNSAANQQFGTIVFVDPSASSLSELMASLLQKSGLPLDLDSAQNLLSGIDAATDGFQKSNTSVTAFEMTAFLLRHGAQRNAQKAVENPATAAFPPSAFFPQVPTQPTQVAQQEEPPFYDDEYGFAPKPHSPQVQQQGQQRTTRNDFATRRDDRGGRKQHRQYPQQQGQQQQGAQAAQNPQGAQGPQNNQGGSQKTQAPSEWLAPKIYKGSTTV